MSATPLAAARHLPSLSVQGFRGIPRLEIERLGQVTLIAGENGVGKTTLLDAVRLYAAQGNYPTIRKMLLDKDEVITVQHDETPVAIPDFAALFHGRQPQHIYIASGPDLPALVIEPSRGLFRRYWSASEDDLNGDQTLLQIYLGGCAWEVRMTPYSERSPVAYRRLGGNGTETLREVPVVALGPNVPDNADIARFWSEVALTDAETRALDTLRLIYGAAIEQVVVVDELAPNRSRSGRRPLVKVKGLGDRVPLRSLGDGALRMYSVALALASSPGSLLLIDEAENGIHHSVQADFWKMVLQTAQENNIQVIATTHSWDCVVGFAKSVRDLEDTDGAFVRLEKTDTAMRAVAYSRQNLIAAAKHGIETR